MAETTIDKVNVEIESNSSKASSGIDSLVASIQKLKGVNSEGVSSLNSLNNSIKQIAGNLSSLNKADSGVNKVTSSLQNLKNYATTLDKSRIKLNLFDNTGTISSIYSGMSAFDKFKSKSMDFASNTTKKISKGMKTAFNNIKEHWSKGDLSKWLKVGAFLGVMSKISKAIAGFIQNSSDYISNINYFNTSMAEMKDTATEFINTMSTKFYLDPSSMMKYMASFNTLIKGFGIGSEAAYIMSKNLTQLTYDYSALTGISMEDMMQKLKSGISGELEPMRAIGVALDQATLQEVAYSLGIEKKISTMTRAQKTELAYYQIMKSTAYAQNLFAKSLATTRSELDGTTKTILLPSTALSILKQQFSQLGRAIGNIFIPILTKMVPYIMAATQLLTQLAQAVANFFGFKLADYDISSGIKNISGGIGDIGDSADKTNKKVKGMLAPFDELNAIDFGDDSTGSGGTGAGVGGGSLGIPLENYDWLQNEELTKKVEEIKQKFMEILPWIEAIGLALLTWKISSSLANFFSTVFGVDKMKALQFALGISLIVGGITLLINGVKKILNGEITPMTIAEAIFGSALVAGGLMLTLGSLGINLPVKLKISGLETFAGIALIVAGLAMAFGSFFSMLKDGFSWFKEILMVIGIALAAVGAVILGVPAGIAAAVAAIVAVVATAVVLIKDNWEAIKAWAIGVWEAVAGFFSGLGEWFNTNVIQPVVQFFQNLWTKITEIAINIWEAIKAPFISAGNWFNTNVIQPILSVVIPIVQKIGEIINTIWQIIVAVFGFVASWVNQNVIQPIIQFFKDLWTKITEIVGNIWNGIVGVFGKIASWINEKVVKPVIKFFTNIFTSIKNIVQNIWNTITSVFGKIASWVNEKVVKPVQKFFTKAWTAIGNTVSGIIKGAINGALSGIEKTINFFIRGLNNVVGIVNKIPGVSIRYVTELSLPRFAEGGFPEVGDLFIANESGPEWISTMGGKSAVANQDQMTTGIRQAAYEGVSQALRENPQSHKTEVNIGNRKVYEGYGSYQTRQANKYGVSTVTI